MAQSDAGSLTAFAVVVNLAILALMIYLAYAIIATRQDVLAIKDRLTEASGAPAAPSTSPVHGVYLLDGGDRPAEVERVLMDRMRYAKSGARGAIRNPGQRVFSSAEPSQAEGVAAELRAAGATVEVR